MRDFVRQGQRGLGADSDVPSCRGFVALLEAFRASGGTVPGHVLARLLEEHQVGQESGQRVSLAKLIFSGQVFGFEWRDSLWLPMFQFDPADLSLKADAQRVRAELPSLPSGWAVALWFAGINRRLNGCSPVDVLGLDPQAVMRAAREHGAVDRPAPAPPSRAREVAAQV